MAVTSVRGHVDGRRGDRRCSTTSRLSAINAGWSARASAVSLHADPDGALHFEGTGEAAWGTKWVLMAVRSNDVHGRVIVDVKWVPAPGGEAVVTVDSVAALAPLCPGAQGVTYDTALRWVHHQRLMRDLGL